MPSTAPSILSRAFSIIQNKFCSTFVPWEITRESDFFLRTQISQEFCYIIWHLRDIQENTFCIEISIPLIYGKKQKNKKLNKLCFELCKTQFVWRGTVQIIALDLFVDIAQVIFLSSTQRKSFTCVQLRTWPCTNPIDTGQTACVQKVVEDTPRETCVRVRKKSEGWHIFRWSGSRVIYSSILFNMHLTASFVCAVRRRVWDTKYKDNPYHFRMLQELVRWWVRHRDLMKNGVSLAGWAKLGVKEDQQVGPQSSAEVGTCLRGKGVLTRETRNYSIVQSTEGWQCLVWGALHGWRNGEEIGCHVRGEAWARLWRIKNFMPRSVHFSPPTVGSSYHVLNWESVIRLTRCIFYNKKKYVKEPGDKMRPLWCQTSASCFAADAPLSSAC